MLIRNLKSYLSTKCKKYFCKYSKNIFLNSIFSKTFVPLRLRVKKNSNENRRLFFRCQVIQSAAAFKPADLLFIKRLIQHYFI